MLLLILQKCLSKYRGRGSVISSGQSACSPCHKLVRLHSNALGKDTTKEMTKEKSQWKELMEALSVLQWVLTFLFLALSCTILSICLMFTSLWPLSALSLMWLVMDWQTPEKGGRRTMFVRKWKVWDHFRDFFPIKLKKTAELSPNKNYIFGCHPHGIMSAGAFSCFGTESSGFTEMYPGVHSRLAILAGLFRIPLFREYVMCAGLYPVSKPSLTHLLSQSEKGNAVVIIIGGAAESLSSSPGANTVVIKQRKGFVKVALEFGADLVPVYSFGENELFQQVIFTDGSIGRKLQDLFKKVMGFAPCLFVGEKYAFLPYRKPVTTVVGSPISVPKRMSPTNDEVDHYHKLYMEALTKLFHENKVSCGLSESHKLLLL